MQADILVEALKEGSIDSATLVSDAENAHDYKHFDQSSLN